MKPVLLLPLALLAVGAAVAAAAWAPWEAPPESVGEAAAEPAETSPAAAGEEAVADVDPAPHRGYLRIVLNNSGEADTVLLDVRDPLGKVALIETVEVPARGTAIREVAGPEGRYRISVSDPLGAAVDFPVDLAACETGAGESMVDLSLEAGLTSFGSDMVSGRLTCLPLAEDAPAGPTTQDVAPAEAGQGGFVRLRVITTGDASLPSYLEITERTSQVSDFRAVVAPGRVETLTSTRSVGVYDVKFQNPVLMGGAVLDLKDCKSRAAEVVMKVVSTGTEFGIEVLPETCIRHP